jgi:hypothetical protein
MARPKDPTLERAWRQRLQRQTSRGLSIPEFCAREGVYCSAFYAWKRRLSAHRRPGRDAARRCAPRRPAPITVARLPTIGVDHSCH